MGAWDIDLTTGLLRGTAQFFRIMGLEPTNRSRCRSKPHAGCAIRRIATVCCRPSTPRSPAATIISGRIPHHSPGWRSPVDRWPRPRDAGRRRHVVRNSGVDIDISDRKLAEAALRESEERFRRVFEQSPLGKAMAGLDFRFRAVNPALCAMLGYTEEELVGRSFLDIVHPDDREICAALGQVADRWFGAADPDRGTLPAQVRRPAVGERQCRTDPRRRRQHPLYTRRHREHRRSQADDRDSAGQRDPAAIAERATGATGRGTRARNWHQAGRCCRRSSSTRRTG